MERLVARRVPVAASCCECTIVEPLDRSVVCRRVGRHPSCTYRRLLDWCCCCCYFVLHSYESLLFLSLILLLQRIDVVSLFRSLSVDKSTLRKRKPTHLTLVF
jgi:hypothetical protein